MTVDPPQSSTSTAAHVAAVLAVLQAVRHETHAENHLQRINTKALTASRTELDGLGKDIRTATRRLAAARAARRTALAELDDLEYRQAQRKHGRPYNRPGDDAA